MKLRRKRNTMALLNITSLINVVFLLLIFFMVTVDFSRLRMIGVDTPQKMDVVDDPTAAIVILIKKDGGFDYDGEPSSRGQIATDVKAILDVDPGRSFLIRPEKGVEIQQAIDMFQMTRDLGAYAVSFSPPEQGGA